MKHRWLCHSYPPITSMRFRTETNLFFSLFLSVWIIAARKFSLRMKDLQVELKWNFISGISIRIHLSSNSHASLGTLSSTKHLAASHVNMMSFPLLTFIHGHCNYLHNISNVYLHRQLQLHATLCNKKEVALYRLSRARVSMDIDASSYKCNTFRPSQLNFLSVIFKNIPELLWS